MGVVGGGGNMWEKMLKGSKGEDIGASKNIKKHKLTSIISPTCIYFFDVPNKKS
jgi:hypothetical protein